MENPKRFICQNLSDGSIIFRDLDTGATATVHPKDIVRWTFTSNAHDLGDAIFDLMELEKFANSCGIK